MSRDLFKAVKKNDLKLAEAILLAGADIEATNYNKNTVLMKARTVEIAKLLVDHGANVNAVTRDKYQQTVLMCVRSSAVVEFLLNHGANIHAKSANGSTALHCAHNSDSYSILLKRGAVVDINLVASGYSSPLHNAAIYASAINVKLLIDHGADVNLRTAEGYTPLMSAHANHAAQKVLIEAGADVNAKNNLGTTALMRSTGVEQASDLIAAGAEINARNNAGQTAFMLPKIQALKQLFAESGADINTQDIDGRTALMLDGNVDSVKYLLGIGVDFRLKDIQGKSALEHENPEIRALINNHSLKTAAAEVFAVNPILNSLNTLQSNASNNIENAGMKANQRQRL